MTQDPLDLDGRIFDLVSSTASRVDPVSPTRFRYRDQHGVVWGGYAGDTVREGRFVGTRSGAVLRVSFVHAPVAGGEPVTGTATSRIEVAHAGLSLVEEFEVDGLAHTSVCREVIRG